ncbi:MAG: glycosyltransferase, partial [Thermoleophilaceae bacterium]|nr:glycosyltransferase [Thermoleophilaceae bacterium]
MPESEPARAEGVGVIVPVRGDSPYLAQALDAILAQEPPPADVVVVDDASDTPVALPRTAAGCRLVRRGLRGG